MKANKQLKKIKKEEENSQIRKKFIVKKPCSLIKF